MKVSARRLRAWRNTAIGGIIIAIMLVPLYWIALTSLEPVVGDIQDLRQPTACTLSLGQLWFSRSGAVAEYLSTVVVSVGTVVVAVGIALPTSYALARFRPPGTGVAQPGTGVVQAALVIVQMIPSMVMATVLFVIFDRIGLINSYPGLIIADSTAAVPFSIMLLRVLMRDIPRDIYEAAEIDGAGALATSLYVAVPLSNGGLVTIAVFSFLFAWGNFIYALVLVTSPNLEPITLTVYNYLGIHEDQWNSVMALGVIASVPVAVILVLGQRYIRWDCLPVSLKG